MISSRTTSEKQTPSVTRDPVHPESLLTARFARWGRYWLATELPRVAQLAALCRSGEDSYLKLDPDDL